MKLSAPRPLAASHQLDAFDCGKPALTEWLLRHARQAQGSGSARTFVACDSERVAGYYSLTVGQIDTLEAPERIRRGMGQYPIPLIILARLAVDLDYQKRGLGFMRRIPVALFRRHRHTHDPFRAVGELGLHLCAAALQDVRPDALP